MHCLQADKRKIEVQAAEPERLEALNTQISSLDESIGRHEAVLQALNEFFDGFPPDPTVEGLRKGLRVATEGIQRYKTIVSSRAAQELQHFRNDGRWTIDNISEHPAVKAENAKAAPIIKSYEADIKALEGRIREVEVILSGAEA